MMDVLNFYQEKAKVYTQKIAEIDRKMLQISLLRIGVMLVVGVCAYFGFASNGWLFAPAFGLFYLFLFLVKLQSITSQERVILKELLTLNEKEIAFKSGDKSVFDAGLDFDTSHHLYALDLDIFGLGSLFQSINRSATHSGRELLGKHLLNPLTSIEEITRRRQTIRDLAKDVDWRQRFYAVGAQTTEKPKDQQQLKDWLGLPDFFEGRVYWKIILMGMSVLSALGILYCIVTVQFNALVLFGVFAINTALLGLLLKDVRTYFILFGSKTKQFRKYADLFAQIRKEKFSTPEGAELQEQCAHASEAFVHLFKLSNAADQRYGFAGPIMNGLFMFDLWSIYNIEKWRSKHKESFDGWIRSLITIDMINSLANFAFNHPEFNDAEIVSGKEFISAMEIGHPLMEPELAVKNDYTIGVTNKLHVITGSNMAGKSTFIRAVGLNLILACNGVPVFAREFKCSIMGLITSIRITDSLEENASYFKAELNRLEKVLNHLRSDKPYLVLLDEILRGTNSDDKRLGTQSFLLKLKQYRCLVLVATHDLGIGKLEEQFPTEVKNYCFESQFTNDGLLFDYKLREGISSSTNATFLMRKLGLID